MKKLFFLFGLLILFFGFTDKAFANVSLQQTDPQVIRDTTKLIKFTFVSDNHDFIVGQGYMLNLQLQNTGPGITNLNIPATAQNKDSLEIDVKPLFNGMKAGDYAYKLCYANDALFEQCSRTTFSTGFITVLTANDLFAIAMDHSIFQSNTQQNVYILNAKPDVTYRIWFNGDIFPLFTASFAENQITKTDKSDRTATATINVGDVGSAKTICMTTLSFIAAGTAGLNCDYKLKFDVTLLAPRNQGSSIQSGQPGVPSTPTPPPGPCGNGKICPTAFGDIQTDPTGFIKSLFSIILSLAGGIAIILIMIAGYRLMSSQGNPEKVQAAREQLTSAIVGLLFIIFSVTILQIIGVDILHIPGFGR